MRSRPRPNVLCQALVVVGVLALVGCTNVRREINSLSTQQVDDFRKGVELMQSRAATNGTSWLYQANIHGVAGAANSCPTTPGSGLPAWNSCQHGQYYFLCWHRMYLHYMEKMLVKAVRDATGRRLSGLPYWDYQANPTLPAAFRNPANATNGLYVAQRRNACNTGGTCVSAGQASSAVALTRIPYCNCPPNMTCVDCQPNLTPAETFGGEFVSGPAHLGNRFGQLERQPHNVVHVAVGGTGGPGVPGGWMSQVNCAARDPIFYLHHANIDRLWQVWLNQGMGRADPVNEPDWRTQSFTFIDVDGATVTKACCDVVHMKNQLGYVYEGLPINNVKFCPKQEGSWLPPPEEEEERIWIGPREPVELRRTTTRVALEIESGVAERLLEAARSEKTERLLLIVEGVRLVSPGGLYELYFDLPEGEEATSDSPDFLGHIALFGDTGEEGADMSFEVTRQLRGRTQREDPAGDLSVTFVWAHREEGVELTTDERERAFVSFEGFSLLRR